MKIKRAIKNISDKFEKNVVIDPFEMGKKRTKVVTGAIELWRKTPIIPDKWKTKTKFGSKKKAIKLKDAYNQKIQDLQWDTGNTVDDFVEFASRNPLSGAAAVSSPMPGSMEVALVGENIIKKKVPGYKRMTDKLGQAYVNSPAPKYVKKAGDELGKRIRFVGTGGQVNFSDIEPEDRLYSILLGKKGTKVLASANELLRKSPLPKKWKPASKIDSQRRAINAANKMDNTYFNTGDAANEFVEFASKNPLTGATMVSTMHVPAPTGEIAAVGEGILKKYVPSYKRMTDKLGQAYVNSPAPKYVKRVGDKAGQVVRGVVDYTRTSTFSNKK